MGVYYMVRKLRISYRQRRRTIYMDRLDNHMYFKNRYNDLFSRGLNYHKYNNSIKNKIVDLEVNEK